MAIKADDAVADVMHICKLAKHKRKVSIIKYSSLIDRLIQILTESAILVLV